MEEVVKRLHEKRRLEQAKKILESNGYSVVKESYDSGNEFINSAWEYLKKHKTCSVKDIHDIADEISSRRTKINPTLVNNFIELRRMDGYDIRESSAYKCYALVEYEPGDGESGIEGDRFYTLDVVKAGDEGEANRYFKSLRGRFPDAYVTEISEKDFDEYQRDQEDNTRRHNESSDPSDQSRVKLRHIIDTWNMIDKYGIKNWKDHDSYITIPAEDYQKMLSSAKNPKYIQNLKMRESAYIRKNFPTEDEAYEYARENGMEIAKTQDTESGCTAWLRKFDYKPKQDREELPD